MPGIKQALDQCQLNNKELYRVIHAIRGCFFAGSTRWKLCLISQTQLRITRHKKKPFLIIHLPKQAQQTRTVVHTSACFRITWRTW